jgi:ATP-dependent helicase/nuclease subunit B
VACDSKHILNAHALPPGEAFFDALALRALALWPAPDLSNLCILTPSLPLAAEVRAAFARVSSGPLLLPCCDTLRHWADSVPLPGIPSPMPESERRVLLYDALRRKDWFDETALWGIANEMARLFDELTAAALTLPDDEAALAAQLQRAYAAQASQPLAFEARVVCELWRALSSAGAPDAQAVYRLRLSEIARRAAQPLLVLLDAPPDEALAPAERDFLRRYATAQPLHVFYPQPRETCASPLAATLAAAWPGPARTAPPPLIERARALARQFPDGTLTGRLTLMPASGREEEARAAVAQIGLWLREGVRKIALVAQDRLTARRVRALLEREQALAGDETGWLLSTSRAAATVDALIEVAGRADHRDFLDLCKSPFVLTDLEENERETAILGLEAAIRAASARWGLARFRRALLASGAPDKNPGFALLDRVETATTLLRGASMPLSRWLERLFAALDTVGARAAFAKDAAGQTLLDLLEERRAELAGNVSPFSLAAFRDWLDHEFEAAAFRDGAIDSPIVLTPLAAVRLRRFEAALLLGGDARELSPVEHAAFFNASVRRELGLPTREDGERALQRSLELLLAMTPRVTVSWQARRDGEANLLSPELSLLSTLHQLAWGDDLRRPPPPLRGEPEADAASAPEASRRAAPAAPPERIPRRVSVSAYASLVACPYRFFARHVLGLGEMDEVAEEMDKSDYGELVHRALERFHARYPCVSALAGDEALRALRACVDEVFAPAIADDFLATGWRLRWEKRLPAYLDWQRAREAEGWRADEAETRVACAVPLAGGGRVELHGRIDRIDRCGKAAALYDYKTQTATVIRKRLADDVQLPAYALMHGAATQAAYVALDGDTIECVASAGDEAALSEAAARQKKRLADAFDALYAGAPLPAHGAESVCQWCEMGGLCRKGFVHTTE